MNDPAFNEWEFDGIFMKSPELIASSKIKAPQIMRTRFDVHFMKYPELIAI